MPNSNSNVEPTSESGNSTKPLVSGLFISLIKELINVGIVEYDDIDVEAWVKNYCKEINCR